MIEAMASVRITVAELARYAHAVLAKVQEGVEAVLGQDHRALSVIRSPRRSGRPISDPQLSDENQKALMIVLDSLVTRSKVSRVMAEL
jgi:hypothetical protein